MIWGIWRSSVKSTRAMEVQTRCPMELVGCCFTPLLHPLSLLHVWRIFSSFSLWQTFGSTP